MLDTTQFRKDGMERHLEILNMLLARNDVWMTKISRPEIKKAHEKVTDLIQQTRNAYIAVLELYDKDNR